MYFVYFYTRCPLRNLPGPPPPQNLPRTIVKILSCLFRSEIIFVSSRHHPHRNSHVPTDARGIYSIPIFHRGGRNISACGASFTRSAERSASAGAECAGKAPGSDLSPRAKPREKTETTKFQLSSPVRPVAREGWFGTNLTVQERGGGERERDGPESSARRRLPRGGFAGTASGGGPGGEKMINVWARS